MSDPMTTMEIEDVLSSIRRLVSEDNRPPSRQPPPPVGRPAEKLVLTPALRIVPEPRTEPAAAIPDRPLPLSAPATAPEFDARSHEAAAAALEAALSARTDDWEPDGSEVTATDWTVEWEATAPPARLIPDPTAEAAEAAEAAPDERAPDEPAPNPVPAALPAAPDPALPEAASLDAAAAPDMPDDAAVADSPPLPAIDTMDTDEAGPPDEAARQTASGAADAGDDAFLFDDEPADDLIDEEMLRDLVREILREELQGTLGERITRNVRKLVRAEINRALAARDLD